MLLKQAHIQITSDGHVIPLEKSIITDMMIDNTPNDTIYHPPEDNTMIGTEPMMDWIPKEEQVIPFKNNIPIEEEEEIEEEKEYIDPESIPEPIMDEERGPYTLAIQVFGEEVVACVLSIKVKCRGRGLGLIEQRIESVQHVARHDTLDELSQFIYFDPHRMDISDDEEGDDEDEEDIKTKSISNFINATLMMIQEAVMDSREPIVTLAISTWHQLNDFCKETGIDTRRIISWIERTFSGLLKRTGDTNSKIKQAATALILVLVQSYSLMSLYICKPERMIHNYKEAKSRVELVEVTVIKLGVENPKKQKSSKTNVPLQDLMAFVVTYLNHGHDEVRQSAVKLVVTISDQIGFSIVSTFIDETLRVSLAEVYKKK